MLMQSRFSREKRNFVLRPRTPAGHPKVNYHRFQPGRGASHPAQVHSTSTIRIIPSSCVLDKERCARHSRAHTTFTLFAARKLMAPLRREVRSKKRSFCVQRRTPSAISISVLSSSIVPKPLDLLNYACARAPFLSTVVQSSL